MSHLSAERPAPGFPAEDVARFQEFFYRRTGIQFGQAKRYFLDRRLQERIEATGSPSLRAYLLALRFEDANGAEFQQLINAMTVNETYFYREEYQFRCLSRELMPTLAKLRPGERLRIWSLPCSTGEEAYSIALHLSENWPDLETIEVEITGSDIDTRVLAEARQGVYDARAVQNLPAPVLERHFEASSPGKWRISRAMREALAFSTVNLADAAAMRAHRGRYDVIFCRNLLIYFDDPSRRQAAETLYDSLRPGGFLCLGHSESMSRMSALFTVRKCADAIVYQRPLA
ncbi:CheR family methyltransferase [Sediminicoccus sp. BL-A-41-H5]|uniref:CheR family methyltransferase n=1 Tax=Sediminicoccus sp. BL-A-41-H5 TaxID=3421106 RepID=UPI003D674691